MARLDSSAEYMGTLRLLNRELYTPYEVHTGLEVPQNRALVAEQSSLLEGVGPISHTS